jgi:putative modified peptide
MIKGTPSKETTVKVLDRLSKDNDFRERFIGDPAAALKEHGIEVDSNKVPAVRNLPSKDEIAKIRDQAAAVENPLEKCGLWVFLLK